MLLYKITDESECGLNYAEYNMELSGEAVKDLNKYLVEKEKKSNVKIKDNGKYYLPKGEYKIVAEFGGETSSAKFVIK